MPHVFHDERLDRLIGDARCLRHLHSDEARGLKLLGSGEHVPSLRELLSLIAGRVPLLIEVKREIGLERLCTAVAGSRAGSQQMLHPFGGG